MADDLPSRYVPKRVPKFSWVGDPARQFSQRGKATITPRQSAEMLQYDKNLYAPDNRNNLFPTTPTPVVPIPASKWTTTGGGELNRIGRKYDDTQAAWLQVPPEPVDNPNLVNPVAAPNPALTGDTSTPPPALAQTFPSGNPDGPQPGVTVNPNTGFPASPTPAERAEDERQRWLAEGGSDATLHRAQAASGMRPAIDARGNSTAANSNAAAEIRQGWGWEPSVTSGSQGTTVAAQMTKTFTDPNTRSGAQQAGWNQKFTDARARLRASLES